MKIRLEAVVVVVAVGTTFLFTVLLGGRPSKPPEEVERQQAGQSRASSRLGVRALAAVLADHGAVVTRLERRYEFIPKDVEVLGVVAPHDAPDEEEIKAIVEWVEDGGTLLYFPTPASGDLAAALGWSLEAGSEAETTCVARLGEERYSLKVSTQSRVNPRRTLDNAAPIAEDELGWVVGAAALGEGHVFVVSDPAIAGNGLLDWADHAPFLVHILFRHAPTRRIAFDEYHHGWTGEQSLVGFIMASPAGWAVLQGLLALTLFTMARRRRLGPPREVHDERRRRPQEFIEAFARLCRKAGSRGLALDLVLADVRDALTRRFGACDRATIEREATRRGRDGARLAAEFEEAKKAVPRAISVGSLLHYQRLLDEIRALTR